MTKNFLDSSKLQKINNGELTAKVKLLRQKQKEQKTLEQEMLRALDEQQNKSQSLSEEEVRREYEDLMSLTKKIISMLGHQRDVTLDVAEKMSRLVVELAAQVEHHESNQKPPAN